MCRDLGTVASFTRVCIMSMRVEQRNQSSGASIARLMCTLNRDESFNLHSHKHV
jgi:hypothetical protein